MRDLPSTMVIATDIVIDVIKNDKEVIRFLKKQASDNKIVLPYSCVLEALELAQKPTFKGLHALAELISISELSVVLGPEVDEGDDAPLIKLTPDVLLSCILGIIKSKQIAAISEKAPIVINDAFLVTALLCVSENDPINTQNLTRALRKINIELIDPDTTDRKAWPKTLSEQMISQIRSKTLNKRTP